MLMTSEITMKCKGKTISKRYTGGHKKIVLVSPRERSVFCSSPLLSHLDASPCCTELSCSHRASAWGLICSSPPQHDQGSPQISGGYSQFTLVFPDRAGGNEGFCQSEFLFCTAGKCTFACDLRKDVLGIVLPVCGLCVICAVEFVNVWFVVCVCG